MTRSRPGTAGRSAHNQQLRRAPLPPPLYDRLLHSNPPFSSSQPLIHPATCIVHVTVALSRRCPSPNCCDALRPRPSAGQVTAAGAGGSVSASDDDPAALSAHMSRLMTARTQGTATSSTAGVASAGTGGSNKVKILRRDTAGSAESGPGVAHVRRDERTAEQRQLEYERARAAIFGHDEDTADDGGSGSGNSGRGDRGRGSGGDRRIQQRLSNSNSAENLSRSRPSPSPPPPATLPEEQREEEATISNVQPPTRSGRSPGAYGVNASSHPIIAELLSKQEREREGAAAAAQGGGSGSGNRRRRNAGKGGKGQSDTDEFSRNSAQAIYNVSSPPPPPPAAYNNPYSSSSPQYQPASYGYEPYRSAPAPAAIPASYYDQQADPYRAYGGQYAPYRQSIRNSNGEAGEGGGQEWDEDESDVGVGGGGAGRGGGGSGGGRGGAYVPEVWDEAEFPSLSNAGTKR